MEYTTVLVHADLSSHAAGRIRMAALAANAAHAHLVGAALTGISRHACPDGPSWHPGSVIASYLDPLFDRAGQALDQFGAVAAGMGVRSYEKRLICDQPDNGLARQARFCDLVVVSQDDPNESLTYTLSTLPEYVVLKCARPVLIVPHAAGLARLADGHALVAWDGSKAATCALSGALPLLRRAAGVTLAYLKAPGQDGKPWRQATANMVTFLGRHGVSAEPLVQPSSGNAGPALLSLAAGLGAGLIVMGCNGHTRARDLFLGNATRTVLREMRVPLLMAH